MFFLSSEKGHSIKDGNRPGQRVNGDTQDAPAESTPTIGASSHDVRNARDTRMGFQSHQRTSWSKHTRRPKHTATPLSFLATSPARFA